MTRFTVWISVVVLVAVAGCGSSLGMKSPGFTSATTGKIFLAPPRDLTHGGEKVSGSGAELQGYLERWLTAYAPSLEVVVSTSGNLSHTEPTVQSVVLEEAGHVGADFALKIVLGDMRDAAAMTFRSDYMTLQNCVLFRVSDGKRLWSVAGYVLQGSNVGDWHSSLNKLAKIIAYNITQN